MIKTFWRSAAPWAFWRTMRMAYAVRWRRLAIYMCLFLLPALLMYVISQSFTAYQAWRDFHDEMAVTIQRTSPVNVLIAEQIELRNQLNAAQADFQRFDEWQNKPQLNADAMLRVAEARSFSELAIERLEGDIIALDVRIQKASQLPPTPIPPPVPLLPEAVRVILSPSSARPGPTLISGTQGFTYPSPAQQNAARSNRNPIVLVGSALAEGGWMVLACLMLLPAAFVLMPWSRKRANVRWAHLGRVTAYSINIALIALALLWMVSLTTSDVSELMTIRLLMFILMGIAIIAWWACAIHYYLHIPNAVVVALLLCVFSLVLCLTCAAWVSHPMSVREFFEYLGFIDAD